MNDVISEFSDSLEQIGRRVRRIEAHLQSGGGVCVEFTCGATGWRGEGGTIARTVVHESAFQLDTFGNIRGTYAIDLQYDREGIAVVTEVASGSHAVILGGRNNIAAGGYTLVYGVSNTVRVNCSETTVFGESNDLTNCDQCLVVGGAHVLNDLNRNIISGWGVIVDNIDGAIKWNNVYMTEVGDTQCGLVAGQEYINTWGVAFSNSYNIDIPIDTVWLISVYIAGTEQGCANSYAWKIEDIVIENDGGTTTLLTGSPAAATNIYRDVVTKEWQAIADDANDRLMFQFRDTAGPDSTTCKITFFVRTAEVSFAA